MKHFLFFLGFVSLIVACKSTTIAIDNENSSQKIIPDPSKNDITMPLSGIEKATSITSLELKETVTFLASDALQGRDTGSDGIEQAAAFIENKFKTYKLPAYYETYRDSFRVGDRHAYNLIGFLEGQNEQLKNEVIIIGAHYDHIGYGKAVANDSIANGANDNAAGTSAVLALAKYFTEAKTNGRSLMFILFSGEEMGLLGSKHLAKKLKTEEINLYTMLNFEMIGVPFTDRDYTAFLTGYELSNMADKINEYAGSQFIGFSQISQQHQLFKASDNYPFYQIFKVPSQTISSCDSSNYDYYHHVHDEANKLDYNHMAKTVNEVLPVIEKMSQTATKEIRLNDE